MNRHERRAQTAQLRKGNKSGDMINVFAMLHLADGGVDVVSFSVVPIHNHNIDKSELLSAIASTPWRHRNDEVCSLIGAYIPLMQSWKTASLFGQFGFVINFHQNDGGHVSCRQVITMSPDQVKEYAKAWAQEHKDTHDIVVHNP